MKNANGWSQLQLRHLTALKTVAEKRSFGGAAEALGYTQSAISHQIGVLEQIVGAKLVERPRGRRPVSLTAAGATLLEHAEAIVARAQAARADLAAASPGATGSLRVGTYQSIGARILPDLLAELSESWPAVTVDLHEASSYEEPFDLVERGEVELSFAELPAPDGPFEAVPLVHDPYILVVSADSELAGTGNPLAPERVNGLRLVGFRDCRCEQRVMTHLRTRGIKTTTVLRADDNRTIQRLVAARRMAAIVPRLTAADDDADTSVLTLDAELPPRVLGIVRHSERPAARVTQEFISIAKRLCAQLQHQLNREVDAVAPRPTRAAPARG